MYQLPYDHLMVVLPNVYYGVCVCVCVLKSFTCWVVVKPGPEICISSSKMLEVILFEVIGLSIYLIWAHFD